MTKKFTQSVVILLFLNLLVKPFWIFGIDRTVQNRAGAEEYGLYFSLFSLSLLLNMVSDFGLTNFNNRYIAQNQNEFDKQLGLLLPVKLVLSMFYCVLTLVTALFIGYSSEQFLMLMLLIFNQMLISLTLYLRSNISALQQFNLDSLISVSDKLLMILICSTLLWANPNWGFKIEWFVLAQSVSYLFTFILVLCIVLKKSVHVQFKSDKNALIPTIKMSLPFALLTLLMVSYTRIDAVMLERMLSDGKMEAGIYAQAFRISDAISMIPFLFASILLPLFARMLKNGEPVNQTLSHSFALLMIPTMGLILAIAVNTNPIMEFLYQKHSEESSQILQFLIIGFGGISLSYIFGTLLTASGKLYFLNLLSLSGLLLNVAMNFILIPGYGAKGAAFASMCTQLAMGIVQALFALKFLKIKLRLSTLLNYFLLGLFLVFVLFIFQELHVKWFFVIILLPIVSVAFALTIRLIKTENLWNVLSRPGGTIG